MQKADVATHSWLEDAQWKRQDRLGVGHQMRQGVMFGLDGDWHG